MYYMCVRYWNVERTWCWAGPGLTRVFLLAYAGSKEDEEELTDEEQIARALKMSLGK